MIYLTYIKRAINVFVPDYGEWDDERNKKFLEHEYGWIDYGQGVPHFDCVAERAVNYFMNRRLGASKVQELISQKIRCGQITREQAIEKLKQEDSVEEPVAVVDEVCRRLGMTREELKPLLDGTALDYRHFKGYARLFQRLSPLFWISYKLGFTPRALYQKYSGPLLP